MKLAELREAGAVFVFISHGAEVDTRALIDELVVRGVQVSVPRVVDGRRMVAAPFPGWDGLVPGTLGIPAPASTRPDPRPPDVVLTPGLAFARHGHRLGYGKGYYDRWFRAHPAPVRVALAFGCQVVEALPVTPSDEPVDLVVTEEEVIRCGGRPAGRV